MAQRQVLPNVHDFIKESLKENDEGDEFGAEIKTINDWLKEAHPDHDEFEWDGKTLKITFKDSEETKTYSASELEEKIPEFTSIQEEFTAESLSSDLKKLIADFKVAMNSAKSAPIKPIDLWVHLGTELGLFDKDKSSEIYKALDESIN